MKIFNDNYISLKKTLLASQGDFKFDKGQIKKSILDTIEDQQLTKATDRINSINRKSFFRQHQLASFTVGVMVIVASSGLALTQINIANPGSRLYVIDQIQEQVLLSLPLPETQKFNLQAKILEERNKELDYIIQQQDENNIKLEAVQESQIMLNSAVDTAWAGMEHSSQQGKSEQKEKYNKALTRLELLAGEQEKRVEDLKKLEKNTDTKDELEKCLQAIKQARQKAKSDPK